MSTTSWGASSDGTAPTCPRHPGRVAYVRCHRCGRPTCPECTRNAPVGVQCVDCVNAAQHEKPRAYVVQGTGGGAVARALSQQPVVTLAIIAVCVVSFLLQQVLPAAQWEQRWIFAPFIGESEPWRFLTAGFLHGGLLHIALNMWALWTVGGFLEQGLGRVRFLALFLLSVIGGQVGVLLLASPTSEAWWVGVLGASGGIFGLFAAVVFELRRLGGSAQSMLLVIGINLVFGFMYSGVAWQAHLGGLATGAVLGFLYSRTQGARRRFQSYALTGVVLVALVALAAWKYQSVGDLWIDG